MVLLFSHAGIVVALLVGSCLTCIDCGAVPQTADFADSLVLPADDTCSRAQARERAWKAEVKPQSESSPFLSAKRDYAGDQADVVYYCASDDRIILRHIFLRFPDAKSAELGFNRQLSALVGDLGRPCVAINHSMRDIEKLALPVAAPANDRHTVIWNVRPGSNAILLFFPGDAKRPWQIQLLFNSLAHIQLSEEAVSIWRAHGCKLPDTADPDTGADTALFIH